jgi:protein disulfide-isomerase
MRFKTGLFLLLSCTRALFAAIEPFEVAEQRAKQENKPLMIFFMGSGWCHWCEEMKKKILSKRDFLRNVENDFIVLEVDFPRDIGKRKNEMTYKKRFGVGRYPTVVIYDPRTEKLFRESGYRELSPRDYAKRLRDKFLEIDSEKVQIGSGGLWGSSESKKSESEAENPIRKSQKYVRGRKTGIETGSGQKQRAIGDDFVASTANPAYQWIQESKKEELAIDLPQSQKSPQFEIRWEKYPKGSAAKIRNAAKNKKLQTVKKKSPRIGFGGNWWKTH